MAEKNILIHIGYPKSGSSFLSDWFQNHPSFIFKEFSITGFKNTGDIIKESITRTETNFKYCVLRDMRFSATEEVKELNGIDEYQEKVCKFLHNLYPESKILIVTRGYESALKAFYSQYIKKGGYKHFQEYADYITNNKWSIFNYNFLINTYINYFGKENVIVLPFELLKEDASLFINKIETELQLKNHFYFNKVKNKSLTNEELFFYRYFSGMIFNSKKINKQIGNLMYKYYTKILNRTKIENKNNYLIKLLSKIFKNKFEKTDVKQETFDQLKGNASSVKKYPVFSKYLTSYLEN